MRLYLLLVLASTPGIVTAQESRPKPQQRVAQIFIVGNCITPQSIILGRLPLFPGMILNRQNVLDAEKALNVLKLISLRCRVYVIDPEGDSEFKDVLIEVTEGLLTPIAVAIYEGTQRVLELVTVLGTSLREGDVAGLVDAVRQFWLPRT